VIASFTPLDLAVALLTLTILFAARMLPLVARRVLGEDDASSPKFDSVDAWCLVGILLFTLLCVLLN
jgi:hypothetical protein